MTHEDERADLISRLLEALVDAPRDLELDAVPLTGRVNWRCKVNISDTGRIVGKLGAHMRALKVVIAAMGRRYQEDWRFEMIEPDDGVRQDRPKMPAPKSYNPSDAGSLLLSIVSAITAHAPEVTIRHSLPDFHFQLGGLTQQDHSILVTPLTVDRASDPPCAALSTLWRAYGRQHGVNFFIELPR